MKKRIQKVWLGMVFGIVLCGFSVSASAATAFVALVNDYQGLENGDIIVNVHLIFSGPDVRPGGDIDIIPVTLTSSDTLQQIRQKITDALVARAQAIGYTLLPGNIIMPGFQKGS